MLKALVKDLKIVFEVTLQEINKLQIGNDILKLKRELELAVAREEFDNAIDIRVISQSIHLVLEQTQTP